MPSQTHPGSCWTAHLGPLWSSRIDTHNSPSQTWMSLVGVRIIQPSRKTGGRKGHRRVGRLGDGREPQPSRATWDGARQGSGCSSGPGPRSPSCRSAQGFGASASSLLGVRGQQPAAGGSMVCWDLCRADLGAWGRVFPRSEPLGGGYGAGAKWASGSQGAWSQPSSPLPIRAAVLATEQGAPCQRTQPGGPTTLGREGPSCHPDRDDGFCKSGRRVSSTMSPWASSPVTWTRLGLPTGPRGPRQGGGGGKRGLLG